MLIPNVKDIELNRWYCCLIGSSEELCKITRALIKDPNTGVTAIAYKVVCYYTGIDLYVGSLTDCRIWLRDRLQLIRKG